jgi:hypothetical protein
MDETHSRLFRMAGFGKSALSVWVVAYRSGIAISCVCFSIN